MVSKKRTDPFTPEPSRGLQAKKAKEYVSPMPRTPLRNVMTPDRKGGIHVDEPVVSSASKNLASDIAGSASRSRLSMSFENLNDDEREKLVSREELVKKRRERKSTLMNPVIGSSPKAAPPQTLSGTKGSLQKSTSAGGVGGGTGGTPLASIIASEAANRPLLSGGKPKMTAEQMNKVFEEWIKIAADNKINSKNTWGLALIDYFGELTFVRDGTSINFQKASCTLDGCVKIYSSRVDSVVDETGKLLNGLTEGNMKNSRYLQDQIGEEDAAENVGEEEDGAEDAGRKKAARKASRHVNTLEKSAEALNLKQLDLEYTADPLFKKTCAEFDESNSRGMLLYNLSMSSACQVIFDTATTGEDVDLPAAENGKIDIGMLKSVFSSQITSVPDRKLCSTFADYSLSDPKNSKYQEDLLAKAMERLSKITIQPVVERSPHERVADQDSAVFDAPPAGFMDDYAPLMDDDYGAYEEDTGPAGVGPGDDYHSEGEATILEEQQVEGFSQNPASHVNMFSYFDESIKQAWAGPNHWKIRRPAFTRSQSGEQGTKAMAPTKKKDFSLQFDDSIEVNVETLFAKPASASTITLTKTQIEDRSVKDNLLPEDLHFSSVNFLRLFTKPSWRFGVNKVNQSRSVRLRPAETRDASAEKEIQEDFWVQNEAHPEGVVDVNFDHEMNPDPMDGIDMPAYYGGDDDGGYDEEVPSATQQTNIGFDLVSLKAGVQVQRLAFSRVAKRVDVHKLKQAIWDEIAVPAVNGKSTKQAAKRFSELVTKLDQTSYPKENLKDVSVSYCFICLLHLANEQNLSIQAEGNDLFVISSKS